MAGTTVQAHKVVRSAVKKKHHVERELRIAEHKQVCIYSITELKHTTSAEAKLAWSHQPNN
jgi:hypothetical protein